jgi:hypothetical protein
MIMPFNQLDMPGIVKKQCDLAGLCFGGCTALDLRLLSLYGGCSDKTNFQLNNTKLGRKKTLKKKTVV